MKISRRDLSLLTIYSGLYAAMVYAFAPISFAALQFRVAGVLRPAIAKKPILALGYAIGVAVGNLVSPFIGFYELFFMPVMSLLAGILGYAASKLLGGGYYTAGAVIAVVIPLSVSWMLNQLFNLPILATLPPLLLSEQIINLIGSSIFKAIERFYRWW
ncbi:MAG: QueT transporter family protein [Candidatus Bathyarchaeia archaeon]|nr:QueT transporter family protein [Candidatus Bathyarchaeota archaeon]